WLAARARGMEEWRGMPGGAVAKQWMPVSRGQPGFYEGWADELSIISQDEIARRIANGGLLEGDRLPEGVIPQGGLDDIFEYTFNGAGQEWRKRLMTTDEKRALYDDPDGWRGYLESVKKRIDQKANHPDLREAIVKGKLGSHPLRSIYNEAALVNTLQ